MRKSGCHSVSLRCGFVLVAVFILSLATIQPCDAARPFVLGMSAPFSGPSRGLGIELYRGAAACFAHVNQGGGINGRRIEILALDDGYDPVPAIDNTIHFLENEEVLCLFSYVGTPTVTRVLPLLKGYDGTRKLLFFPFSGAQPQREFPYERHVFNARASYRQEIRGLVDKFVGLGRTRVAVLYQVDAFGRSGWDGTRRALAKHGLELAGEATFSRGACFGDSMNAQVEVLRKAAPDVILAVGPYAACAAFVRDARDAGLDVPVATLSFVGSENMLKLLQSAQRDSGRVYTRDIVNSQVVPSYEDLSLPAVREYRADMDSLAQAAPDKAEQGYAPLRYSFVSLEGYLNARVMTAILRKFAESPENGLAAAAESIRNLEVGVGIRIGFDKDCHQGPGNVYFTTIRDGKFVPIRPEDWARWQK
ncbi:ABC transporter substrate-binding protein [Pseudodesulfovibrio tunisiensis]|uniref:ABC transporter substrate-binding protein n=1 Tax=Pseudodesulfovibrio tunisiensis TaxID=463192 RepID=UPI001FB2EB32|nr:ABC transporter substrate-binding protein [Pseudodesulfovibrio tunisiensis]